MNEKAIEPDEAGPVNCPRSQERVFVVREFVAERLNDNDLECYMTRIPEYISLNMSSCESVSSR